MGNTPTKVVNENGPVRTLLKPLPQTPVTKEELLRAMDEWGAAGFNVTDQSVSFLNFFLKERDAAWYWRQ